MKGERIDDGLRVLNWTLNLAFVGFSVFLIWYLGWLWGLAAIAFGLAGAPTCVYRAAILDRLKRVQEIGRRFGVGAVIEGGDRVAVEVTVLSPEWSLRGHSGTLAQARSATC